MIPGLQHPQTMIPGSLTQYIQSETIPSLDPGLPAYIKHDPRLTAFYYHDPELKVFPNHDQRPKKFQTMILGL